VEIPIDQLKQFIIFTIRMTRKTIQILLRKLIRMKMRRKIKVMEVGFKMIIRRKHSKMKSNNF
jgi:hypothetical protein